MTEEKAKQGEEVNAQKCEAGSWSKGAYMKVLSNQILVRQDLTKTAKQG